jgi:hypothetical protein
MPGKKKCPNCQAELGVRTRECPNCKHQFVSKVIVKKEKIETKIVTKEKEDKPEINDPYNTPEDKIIAHSGKNVHCLSGIEHADRILAMGKDKAKSLLMAHQTGNTWVHVDWKYLEGKLNEQK